MFGVEIREVDLKLRGPDDIEGTQQNGVLGLKIEDLVHDGQILQMARAAAQTVLNEDADLKLEKNESFRKEFDT